MNSSEFHHRLLADCDWIVEVIIEQPGPKQELFAKLERIAPNAIVTSNTSGIPMEILLKGRTDTFKPNFLGTHYFNPPRYMHLLEIIPTPHPARETLETIREFSERCMGKGIVVCKDVPGFVANRLGLWHVRDVQADGGVQPHHRRGGRPHRPAHRARQDGDVPHG